MQLNFRPVCVELQHNIPISRHADLFVVCLQEPTLGTAYLVGAVRSTTS